MTHPPNSIYPLANRKNLQTAILNQIKKSTWTGQDQPTNHKLALILISNIIFFNQ